MDLFYERKEQKNKVVITYKYSALFYLVLLAAVIVSGIVPSSFQWYMVVLVLLLGTIYIALKIKPNREIREAAKRGKLKVSGSKFSFKNPLTFEITKH